MSLGVTRRTSLAGRHSLGVVLPNEDLRRFELDGLVDKLLTEVEAFIGDRETDSSGSRSLSMIMNSVLSTGSLEAASMERCVLVALLLLLMPFASIAAPLPKTDHPLISAYEGSVIRRKDVKEFDEYNAFTGMAESGEEPTGLQLEGKVTKIIYTTPRERSVLEVYRNYENAIAQAGAEVLYTCNQEKKECAERYAGPTLQKYSDIHSISNLAGRYLLARIDQDEHTAYVAIAVSQSSTTIHVIEVKKMDLGLVSLDATALGKGLDDRGYVIVEGIFFDTDEATLQPESAAALEEMARLLKARTNLEVYIVGHTDSQGSFAHNQALSRNRANAVVEALAVDHGVSRTRMEGHGVGPLAPQASNSNASGRARNRRVVMVAR